MLASTKTSLLLKEKWKIEKRNLNARFIETQCRIIKNMGFHRHSLLLLMFRIMSGRTSMEAILPGMREEIIKTEKVSLPERQRLIQILTLTFMSIFISVQRC